MNQFHPDLRGARFLPRTMVPRSLVPLLQRLQPRVPEPPAGIEVRNHFAPGPGGHGAVRLRVYLPERRSSPVPVLYWFHGGGFLIGSPEIDEDRSLRTVQELGVAVVSPAYRLAPRHPHPAALDDALAGLDWLQERAPELGIDADRLAVGGASAGGGLAAGLAQRLHDEGAIAPAMQLLVYPMLDDRTVLREDVDDRRHRMWNARSNLYAWRSYLGLEPGGPRALAYAVPARRQDLSGLPPAWIGVGDHDLFHDEDIAYAERLREAGVPVRLETVPGAFHGFDTAYPDATLVREFLATQLEELRRRLLEP